jgi:hypothetical protein
MSTPKEDPRGEWVLMDSNGEPVDESQGMGVV